MGAGRRPVGCCVLALVCGACGSGTPSDRGNDAAADGGIGLDSPADATTDGAPASGGDGASPPADLAGELATALPDGQCKPQGAILSVSLDGQSFGAMDWKPEDLRTTGTVESASSFDSDAGSTEFVVEISFAGLAIGTWSPVALGTSIQYDDIVKCGGAAVTGAVRITRVIADAGPYAGEVCGIYDLDCTDTASGHMLRIRCSFDSVVSTGTGPGGP